MSLIKEDSIKVINLDDRRRLLHIFNEYFKSILNSEDLSLEKAVNNNMVIGYAYHILDNHTCWDKILLSNMQLIKNELLANKFNGKISLHDGLVRIAYSTYFVWKNTGYFKKFLYSLNDLIIQMADDYLNYYNKNKNEIKKELFSYLSGLAGVCGYLLEFQHQYQVSIEKILTFLIHINTEKDTPIKTDFYYKNISHELDFGLSLGIAGPLSIMVKAYNSGISINGLEKTMYSIINTYKKFSIYKNTTLTYWPGILQPSEYNEITNNINANIKETWSHGALPIARVLYLAGESLGDYNLTNWASNILLKKSRMSPQEFVITNPSLFDGYSGLLCIFDAMYKDHSVIEYIKIINSLLRKIMSTYTEVPKPTFKLTDLLLTSNRITEIEYFDNYSIESGNTGIVLSLLSTFFTNNHLFHRYLAIT